MNSSLNKNDTQISANERIQNVKNICQERGLRLTAQRSEVLKLLIEQQRAMGAYELLDLLVQKGHSAQPPVVYRALAFLTENGFAHKIERLNAYIACQFCAHQHQPAFLICKSCEHVGEQCIEKSVLTNSDFEVLNEIIEAEGICANCKTHDHA